MNHFAGRSALVRVVALLLFAVAATPLFAQAPPPLTVTATATTPSPNPIPVNQMAQAAAERHGIERPIRELPLFAPTADVDLVHPGPTPAAGPGHPV